MCSEFVQTFVQQHTSQLLDDKANDYKECFSNWLSYLLQPYKLLTDIHEFGKVFTVRDTATLLHSQHEFSVFAHNEDGCLCECMLDIGKQELRIRTIDPSNISAADASSPNNCEHCEIEIAVMKRSLQLPYYLVLQVFQCDECGYCLCKDCSKFIHTARRFEST